MTHRVNALFEQRDQAAEAVRALRARDFDDRTLTVIARADDLPRGNTEHTDQANKTTAAWTGSALGAAVGGYLGLLSMVLVPALPLLVVGGAAVGGAIGSLTGLGVADRELDAVRETLQGGGVLLVVNEESDERAQLAREVLTKSEAKTVSASERDS